MPRPPRNYTAGLYHVAAHGSDQRRLFLNDDDREAFVRRLADVLGALRIELVCYTLLDNHYHAILYTPDARLAAGLRRVHGGYSLDRNRRYGRRAHLFRAHCLARRIDDDRDLLTVCRYVAINPVEARIVLDPFDWPWASTRTHAGLAPCSVKLHEQHLRAVFGDTATWRGRYRDYLSAG